MYSCTQRTRGPCQCDYRVLPDADNIDRRIIERAEPVHEILMKETLAVKRLKVQQAQSLAQTVSDDDLEDIRLHLMSATANQDLVERLESCTRVADLLAQFAVDSKLRVPWWDWQKTVKLVKHLLPDDHHPMNNDMKAVELQLNGCSTIQRVIEQYFEKRTYELNQKFEDRKALICLTDGEWEESESYRDIASMLGTDNNRLKYEIVVFCSVSTAMHRRDISPPNLDYFDELLHQSEATKEVASVSFQKSTGEFDQKLCSHMATKEVDSDVIADFDSPIEFPPPKLCQRCHDNPRIFVLPELPLQRSLTSADGESKFPLAQICQKCHDNLCSFVVPKLCVPEPTSDVNPLGVEYFLASSSSTSGNTGDLQPVAKPFN